jgi:predicted porin
MKKTLIALAAVAVSSAAMAQVTISGAIGMAWQNSAGTTTMGRSDGNVNFTATEDLGGGLKATAVGGIDLQNRGAGVNGRNISLNLSGGFGSLTMANVNSASSTRLSGAGGTISLDEDIDDVYGSDGNINSISYVSPAIMPGVTIGVGVSGSAYVSESFGTFDETGLAVDEDGEVDAPVKATSSTKPTTASTDFSVNYSAGPAKFTLTYRPDDSRVRTSGSYNFGIASVGFGYIPEYTKSDDTVVEDQVEYEVWAPLASNITVGFQSGKRGDDEGTVYGVKYDLSKRTNIVASFGKINDETQQRVRLLHSF